MPNKAPVEKVGGPQEQGPWPDHVDEIAEGEQYDRDVVRADGTVGTHTVTITGIIELVDEQGNPTDGFAVSYQFDDPTVGGSE